MSEGETGKSDQIDVAPLTATMSQLSTSGSNSSQVIGGLVTHKVGSSDSLFQVPLPFTGPSASFSKFSNSHSNNRLQRQRSKSLTTHQQHHQGSLQPKMAHLQDGSTPPPPQKSMGASGSSGNYVARPSPSAFHSTGVLSKKGRGSGLYGPGASSEGSKITPETPIKHKRVLGSIWSGIDGPTNGVSMLKPGPISANSSKNVAYSGFPSRGHESSIADSLTSQETPLKRSTPSSSSFPSHFSHPKNNSHRNTPHLYSSSTSSSALGKPPHIPSSHSSFNYSVSPGGKAGEATTPSIVSIASAKSSRLHRSPLKETPTKLFKRPHLDRDEEDGRYSLDNLNENPSPQLHHKILLPNENERPPFFGNLGLEQTANVPSQQPIAHPSTQNVSGMDIVIDDPGNTPLDDTMDVNLEDKSCDQTTIFKDSSVYPTSLMVLDSPGQSGSLSLPIQKPMQPPSTIEQDRNLPPISATRPSPIIPAKLFFSRIVKERKNAPAPSLTPSIPFTALISRYRHSIDQVFFDAVDGVQPGLDLTLSLIARQGSGRSENGSAALPVPDWFESRFELIGRLGQGEFADAFHVLSLDDGVEYAIKKTRHPFIGYKDAIQKLNEIRMLLQVKASPYCVRLIDAWIQFGYIYIQTEICKRGSLATYLEEHCSETPVTEDQIWRILADISQGIYHIHQKGMVHLDLKPGNIFISKNGTLKIGDFGLACRPPVMNGDVEGDRTYLAPEFLTSPTVSFPADIYSLGLILLEMAANIILPQNGMVWQQLREGCITGISLQRHSQMLVDFIQSMLHPNPSQRPTITDLLQHPKLASLIH